MTEQKPHFVFLWIPSQSENKESGNELLNRIRMYQSVVNLLHKQSTVQAEFSVILNLKQLVTCLEKPLPGCRPVYLLMGHGRSETGEMNFWDGTWLSPNNLMMAWRNAGQQPCDLIATQCGANVFVNPMRYPILLQYNTRIRFMAAAEPCADKSYHSTTVNQQETLHVELTTLLIHYLRVYDNGCDQAWMKRCIAWVELIKQRRAPVVETPSLPPPPQQPPQPATVVPEPVSLVNLCRRMTSKVKTACLVLFCFFVFLLITSPFKGVMFYVVAAIAGHSLYRFLQFVNQ